MPNFRTTGGDSAISHELQYKREGEVPPELRRRLSRLAGLFEIVDDEFVALRDARRRALKRIKAELNARPSDVPLSIDSVRHYVETSLTPRRLVEEAKECGLKGYHNESVDFAPLVAEAQQSGIKTIGQLEDALKGQLGTIAPFLRTLFSTSGSPWSAGAELLLRVLLIRAFPDALDMHFLRTHGWERDWAATVHRAVTEIALSVQNFECWFTRGPSTPNREIVRRPETGL